MKSTESDDQPFSYVGEELELFSHAVNWKAYWARRLAPYIGVDVLEVGAGTGTNTVNLCTERQTRWVCLEPDGSLVDALKAKLTGISRRPKILESIVGDLSALPPDSKFDTILYIDVLEHIGPDQQEMENAYRLLAPGGHVIVLSPAHQFLYTTFDEGLGHFRRYSRRTLREAGPRGFPPSRLFYLDSVGFFASLANRMIMKQKLPTIGQIKFWDSYLVRTSLWVDPVLGYNFGKTVVGIWKRA